MATMTPDETRDFLEQMRVTEAEMEAQGKRTCDVCFQWRHSSEFSVRKDETTDVCKMCTNLKQLVSRHADLNVTAYQSALALGCETCGSFDNLAIDHDHGCCPSQRSCRKCRRGVLCYRCNSGVGLFRDSTTALRACADYLDRHAGSNTF
jgi:hypothetical protein